MKKMAQIFILVLICWLEIQPVALSQASLDEIVANLIVRKIQNMRVKYEGDYYFLYLDVTLENANEQDVRLTNNRFDFYICHSQRSMDCRDKNPQFVTYIGSDTRYRREHIELNRKQIDTIRLKIDLGDNYDDIFHSMQEIINLIVNSSADSTVFIEAGFNLGLKTEQGWTFAEAGIERLYRLLLQSGVPIDSCS